jgi:hypothetical protein
MSEEKVTSSEEKSEFKYPGFPYEESIFSNKYGRLWLRVEYNDDEPEVFLAVAPLDQECPDYWLQLSQRVQGQLQGLLTDVILCDGE